MDSRILNVLHDDPFDDNYEKYNGAEFWTNSNDTLGMQLTETLNGILPITATDDINTIYNGNTLLKDDLSFENRNDTILQNKNTLIYDDFTGQHITVEGETIEIVTIDPHAGDYGSESDDYEDGDFDGNIGELEFDTFSQHSQQSAATFRTRTDSSSIGDYESHSSDYDDDDDDVVGKFGAEEGTLFNSVEDGNIHTDLLAADNLILDSSITQSSDVVIRGCAVEKNRTLSTNTDVDGLALQIDTNTFDLADFITKDDFALNTTPKKSIARKRERRTIPTKPQVMSSESFIGTINASDSDADSDIIVDVETVDLNGSVDKSLWSSALIEHVHFVDNVRGDPSWSPKQVKKFESHSKEVKNISTATNEKHKSCRIGKQSKSSQSSMGKIASKKAPNVVENVNNHFSKVIAPQTRVAHGIGKGGKNLAMIKHDCQSIVENEGVVDNSTITSGSNELPIIASTEQKQQQQQQPIKRKLNLEEYKKRRNEYAHSTAQQHEKSITQNGKLNTPPQQLRVSTQMYAPTVLTPSAQVVKHSEEVTTIVKILKEQMHQKLPEQPPNDPITEAKNKVLRMQQQKRAQQIKILDSTVSAKVPRITKLLPLKEIVKDSYSDSALAAADRTAEPALKTHPDYEEIIIVSTSCNTDITMPPLLSIANDDTTKTSSKHTASGSARSLLKIKNSALLYNFSDTLQKVQATESVKISTNSLITSIQNVVVNKSLPLVERVTTNVCGSDPQNAEHGAEHGEDKIIMHLRKDRIRKRTCNAATQTDLQSTFPQMSLPKVAIAAIAGDSSVAVSHKSRDNTLRKTHRRYQKRTASASSIDSDDSYTRTRTRSRSPLVQHAYRRSHSRSDVADSCSSSLEHKRLHGGDGDTGAGTTSSRSSRRHRSSISSSYSESGRVARTRNRRQRKTSYKQKQRARQRSRSSSSSSTSTSSMSDYSYRSRSPHHRPRSNSRRNGYTNNNYNIERNVSKPAVEERRIVYVGRIEEETTKEMLRRKFINYGTIRQITIHYKDTGMKYGFVTYERSQDAFAVIDNSANDAQINMYDISFGGRRAFCRASYADLDNAGINTYQSYVFPKVVAPPKEEDSFEALLLKVKAKMNANKVANSNTDVSKV